REEYKQTEGDPKIKGRIRQIQMQWAMRRMMTEVPKADVVITNPTHFAVALRYKHKEMAAPRVVAKGADLIALRIRQTAEENGVPVVENPPLARALFHEVEIGETIGSDLFAPVAEVLAYIYKLKNRRVG
ncbi:MAG TPA: EscU/YscU/HrcU family type III secretion system export apparatus switch protein, partial [Candidatus Aminicenantes bacterium]|nr:EscU/YscU/HrcU family type III secretion system export apparatus switch protein [Candidatus Aminicenantes bacterium]